MSAYAPAEGLAFLHWKGESAAVVRVQSAGNTHLIGIEAVAVLQAAGEGPQGLTVQEIAHALDLDGDADDEVEAGLQGIIAGLLQSGLLRRVDESTHPGLESPR